MENREIAKDLLVALIDKNIVFTKDYGPDPKSVINNAANNVAEAYKIIHKAVVEASDSIKRTP